MNYQTQTAVIEKVFTNQDADAAPGESGTVVPPDPMPQEEEKEENAENTPA